MPEGKKAGLPCVNLGPGLECLVHNSPDYPKVCAGLKPSFEMCGNSAQEARDYLQNLELQTQPD